MKERIIRELKRLDNTYTYACPITDVNHIAPTPITLETLVGLFAPPRLPYQPNPMPPSIEPSVERVTLTPPDEPELEFIPVPPLKGCGHPGNPPVVLHKFKFEYKGMMNGQTTSALKVLIDELLGTPKEMKVDDVRPLYKKANVAIDQDKLIHGIKNLLASHKSLHMMAKCWPACKGIVGVYHKDLYDNINKLLASSINQRLLSIDGHSLLELAESMEDFAGKLTKYESSLAAYESIGEKNIAIKIKNDEAKKEFEADLAKKKRKYKEDEKAYEDEKKEADDSFDAVVSAYGKADVAITQTRKDFTKAKDAFDQCELYVRYLESQHNSLQLRHESFTAMPKVTPADSKNYNDQVKAHNEHVTNFNEEANEYSNLLFDTFNSIIHSYGKSTKSYNVCVSSYNESLAAYNTLLRRLKFKKR